MKTLQRICAGYLLFDLFGTTIASGMGIYALYVLTDGSIPAWQTAMLTRCMLFVPLFLFWGKIALLTQTDNSEEMKTEAGVTKFQRTTLTRMVSQALVIGFIAWQYPPTRNVFWLQLTVPMLLIYAMLCFIFFIVLPLSMAIEAKSITLKDVGYGLVFILAYSVVFAPAVFLMIPILEYNIHTHFTDHITLAGTLSILAIFWYAIHETWAIIWTMSGGGEDVDFRTLFRKEPAPYRSARKINQEMIDNWKKKEGKKN